MSSKNKSSFTVQQARATAAIAGIQKYYSATATLLLAGTSYTPAGLVSLLQAYVSAITALLALHAQLHDAVSEGKAQRDQINTILVALEGLVVSSFGSSSSKLNDFGFTPRKQADVTVATKAKAQSKSLATRDGKKAALASASAPATPPASTTVSSGTTVKV